MSNKKLIVDQKVQIGAKQGVIIEVGDKYKVKFDDGDFGFFQEGQITPIVLESELKSFGETEPSQEMPDKDMMESTATGQDPLAQPNNPVTPGIGEEQNVLGKSVTDDVLGGNMKKQKVIDEEVEEPVDKEMDEEEEEKKKKSKKESEDEDEKCNEVEKSDDEDEDDVEKQEDLEDESEKEAPDEEEEKKKKKKSKKKKKKESEEDEDDVEKAEGESPEEDAEDSNEAPNTIEPNASVPSQAQNVFVPPSDVDGKREQVTPMGKSVNADLMKSPLFMNLSSQIEGIKDAVSTRVEALEKSVNDRLKNVQKDMAEIEKFYKQSFHKAIGENVAPESTQALSIKKQLESGNVRFRQ